MKKAILSALVMLMGASAMAQMYPGGVVGGPVMAPPPPPPPVYYPGGGGYYPPPRNDANDQASAMSAVTGAMFLSLASVCASGPGCVYKKLVDEAQPDIAMYNVDGIVRPNLQAAVAAFEKILPKNIEATLDDVINGLSELKDKVQ